MWSGELYASNLTAASLPAPKFAFRIKERRGEGAGGGWGGKKGLLGTHHLLFVSAFWVGSRQMCEDSKERRNLCSNAGCAS